MYAQRDAQALWNFWVNQGRFLKEHCLLLTDVPFASEPPATYPNRGNIINTIDQFCQQLQPDDVLWCFFSGYGVRFQGKDYLMPIEADPKQVESTGIAVESLFNSLHTAPNSNIIVLLDVNRSQGRFNGEGVGQETINLADRYGITVFLSCLPEQFAHETLVLRHSLFAEALLEGLRFHGCVTVTQLATYLRDRLPQLSDHYWRPRQDPLTVIAPTHSHQLIVPTGVPVAVGGSTATSEPSLNPDLPAEYSPQRESSPLTTLREREPTGFPASTPGVQEMTYATNGKYPLPTTASPNGHVPVTEPAANQPTPTLDDADDRFWQQRLPWIILISVLLPLAVFLINRSAFDNPATTPSPHAANPAEQPLTSTDNAIAAVKNPAVTLPDTPTPSTPSSSGTTPPPGSSSQPADNSASPLPLASIPPQQEPLSDNSSLRSVREALQVQRYEVAAGLLANIPTSQRGVDYNTLLQQTNQGLRRKAIALVSRADRPDSSNQASDYSQAIQMASLIKPGQPLASEAQQDRQRWSQAIITLAKTRAAQPNQGSSITAARHYRSAISAARLVPASQLQEQAIAQQLIEGWSQTILTLAQTRAAEGRLGDAIDTASLVPEATPAYDAANQAIGQWVAQVSR